MSSPFTRDESTASGQVFEFRVWAALSEQSRGALHMFLPMADRGIDALVHRLTDDTYISVQTKGRKVLVDGEINLVLWADSFCDDEALIVSGLLTNGSLGPAMLVIEAADFKRLAEQSQADGRPIYTMSFSMAPGSDSPWAPFVTPTERLAERFGIPADSMPEVAASEASSTWRSDLSFLGEAEVVRLLAESADLDLFRPFPDLEASEVGVLHERSRKVVGVQVKTVSVDRAHPSATVSVPASSFRPSPNTHFVVLGWLREEGRFDDECLLIPSESLRGVCQPRESYGHLKFEWDPGSTYQDRLDPFRRQRSTLKTAVEELSAGKGW